MNTQTKPNKQDIFFIEDGDEGLLAHSRQAAHQWLDNFLDDLKNQTTQWGEQRTVIFEYRAMAKRQLHKLPTLD